MNKNQHERREYAINPGISQEEIDRKWRLYTEEQERMEFMEIIANLNRSMAPSIPTGSGPLYPPGMFVTTWNTTLTSSGSTALNQIKLPLVSTGLYYFFVEWGDGTSAIINSYNQTETTHTYVSPGVYIVKIVGTCQGWTFSNAGDRLKLLDVIQWGTLRPGNNDSIFRGCFNLKLDKVADVLDTTGMTTFYYLFQGCLSLVRVNRINEWNTSNIINMGQVFDSCIAFNDNIGNWNMSNVTSLDRMFAHAGEFNNGGSPDINNWDTANVTYMRFMLGTDGTVPGGTIMKFNQPIGNWNTSKVTNMSSLFSRNNVFNQDISTKVVTRNGITYTAWDTSNVLDMSFIFSSAPLFGQFNQNIGNWNTSKAISMNTMFQGQGEFNQDVSTKVVTVGGSTYTAWDVSNATDLRFMFSAGTGNSGKFNQNIGNWNTSKVISLSSFAFNQPFFNQDISTKVVTVGGSTYTAWDTTNVATLATAFAISIGATSGQFNQNIGNWNTSKVASIANSFYGQSFFNQDISTKVVTVGGSTYTAWDMLNVTNMSSAFAIYGGQGRFNQNIGNWNTSKGIQMNTIFQNQPVFNQDISTKTVTVGASTYTAWDMLNATTTRYMFYNNLSNSPSAFNQNIGNWNTVKVNEMTAMLYNTSSFNQNIGAWKVNLVTIFNGTGTAVADTFAEYNGLSQANYDALLIGWASRPVLANKSINFGNRTYSSAALSARSVLTSSPNFWTIVDGGLAA